MPAARLIERIDPRSRRLRPVAVVDTLARSVAMEMDLRLEAAALSEMAELTAGDQGFRVPTVEWELTARDVLTLEWIDGIKLSDIDALKAAGHDLPLVARRLMQAFLRQALRDGFFHADMHQGNLFVDAAGDIVAIDFGIMGGSAGPERRFLAEILYGFIRRDYRRIAEVHFDAGYVPATHSVEDFAQALRAIGEPIHGQSAADISMARLLALLFEVTEIFDMQTRPELLLVQKTMVVVEGVCRTLDPDFDMWSTSEPVVADWIERFLGPPARWSWRRRASARSGGWPPNCRASPNGPSGCRPRSTAWPSSGIRLDPETIAEIGRSEARGGRWGRIALVVIAVVAVVVGLKLDLLARCLTAGRAAGRFVAMSRAFVKEDAGGDEGLPDRPVSPHPNYVTPEGLAQIDARACAAAGRPSIAAGEDRAARAAVERDLRYWRARRASAASDPAACRRLGRALRRDGDHRTGRRPPAGLAHRRRGRGRSEGRARCPTFRRWRGR